MRINERLPELLAPAGDMQALYAALKAGADAVYVGGKRFGARAYAKNFDDEELRAAVSYCHLHGAKLYVTVNTLVFDKELGALCEYARFLYEIGVDAVIAADLGAIRAMRSVAPKLEIHASTQMSVHNTEGARAAAALGVSRVVLARELSYADICEITRDAPTETEVFLHGALCVCHSGQCLFSSLVGGRSGNRGECAQPCRLPYNDGKFPLSLKDLSLAGHVRELIASGTASLKIEGRMKSADYVFKVTSIYRRLLDEGRDATKEESAELARIFSRGGFTDGYFTGRLAEKMTGVRSDADKCETREASGGSFAPEKRRVSASARFVVGERCEMSIWDSKKRIDVRGETVLAAINAALDADDVKKRLSKMGNTLLSLSEEDVELEISEGAYLPLGAINALRRAAAEAFEYTGREGAFEEMCESGRRVKNSLKNTALFLSPERLLSVGKSTLSRFDAVFVPAFASDAVFERANGVYLPPVLRNSDFPRLRERLEKLRENGILYTLVGNLSHISLSLELGFIPVSDTRMNITNSQSRKALMELGVNEAVLSVELDLPKARDIGGGVAVYGHIPLMLTERCFAKENFSCAECGTSCFVDRRGKKFPILREFEHRNLILNSEITYMADKGDLLDGAGLCRHFIFTVETPREIERVADAFSRGESIESVFPGERPRRIGMRENDFKKNKR